MKQRAYISGPMTGYKDDNRPAFRDAARVLRERGYDVLSPDEFDDIKPIASGRWGDYLRRDLPCVCVADVVFVLPGWRASKGATLEVLVAAQLGIPVQALTPEGAVQINTDDLPYPVHPGVGRKVWT